MEPHPGMSRSAWLAPNEMPQPAPLSEHAKADVCVIGAGIAGLSVAYACAAAKLSVIVIDAGPIAGGETSRTTAHLVTAADDRFYFLEKIHGARGAVLWAESNARAIDWVERVCEESEV